MNWIVWRDKGLRVGPKGYLKTLRDAVGSRLLPVASAAACIRDEDGRILLLKRSDGDDLWGFPGGAIEPGESASEALMREVAEETGLRVRPVAVIGVYSDASYAFAYPNGDRVQPIVTFFECEVVGGTLAVDGEEIVGGRYFGSEGELPRMRPCCIAKAHDAFRFEGRAFFR